VDFLPGLVAPRRKRAVLNWVNKLPVFFTFLHFIFLFYFYLSHNVETLIGTSQTLKHLTEHIKTSALEFHNMLEGNFIELQATLETHTLRETDICTEKEKTN